jgi:hypothetical protein
VACHIPIHFGGRMVVDGTTIFEIGSERVNR